MATVPLYGIGQGPLGLIQPGVVTQPVTYADYLYQSVVGEDGTVYLTSGDGDAVFSLPPGGTALGSIPVSVTGPTGIAIDGAGTLYIAENTYETSVVTFGGGVQGSLSLVPPAPPYMPCSTAEYFNGVAVDGLGDVFATEIECQQIFERMPSGTFVTTPIAPAITQPGPMTVDSAGNVFVSGYTLNELTAGGVQSQVNANGTSEGLAVDAAGTLYAARNGSSPGVTMLAASDYSTLFATLDSAPAPLGVSVGPDGTVYVGNYTNLDRVDRSQGAVGFGEQTAGSPSSVQLVSLYNGGNQPLTLAGMTVTGDEGFVAQSGGASPCAINPVVQPGALCTIAVGCTLPHAGMFSGTLALTSNSQNTTTTQNVALSGFVYGPYVTPSSNPFDVGSILVGATSATQMVTLTNNGDLYAAGIGTPSVDNSAFSVTLGTCTTSVAVGSSCQLAVTFTPASQGAASGHVTIDVSSGGGGVVPALTFTLDGVGTVPQPDAGADAALVLADAGIEASTPPAQDASAIDAMASIPPPASDASAMEDATTGTLTPPAEDAETQTAPDASVVAVRDAQAAGFSYDAASIEAGPITIEPPPTPTSGGGGCSAAGTRSHGDAAEWALAASALAVVLRRRKRSRNDASA